MANILVVPEPASGSHFAVVVSYKASLMRFAYLLGIASLVTPYRKDSTSCGCLAQTLLHLH